MNAHFHKLNKHKRLLYRTSVLLFTLFSLICNAAAQNKTIKGTATNADSSEPLIGVSVKDEIQQGPTLEIF